MARCYLLRIGEGRRGERRRRWCIRLIPYSPNRINMINDSLSDITKHILLVSIDVRTYIYPVLANG